MQILKLELENYEVLYELFKLLPNHMYHLKHLKSEAYINMLYEKLIL